MPVEGRRQMAEIDVAADPPLGPQPFDGGVQDPNFLKLHEGIRRLLLRVLAEIYPVEPIR